MTYNLISLLRILWVLGFYCSTALLWLALTIYPTKWFGLPWWATLGLAIFWLWQIELARPKAKEIMLNGLAFIEDWRAALRQ